MKKNIHVISFFAIAICFGSCVETVSMKDLGIKPKLVLYCFLSPQYDTIPIFLSNSQPLFSSVKTVMEVTDAIVEISDDNKNWTQIPYNKDTKRYLLIQSLFPIAEGKTYSIRATAPNYESISSSCTVPFWREVDLKPEVEFVPKKEQDDPQGMLSISWKDYPGEQNYYAFIKYHFWIRDWDNEVHADIQYLFGRENDEIVISDERKDGERLNVLMEYMYWSSPSDFMDYCEQYDSVYILLIQTDRNTFLYENSAATAIGLEDLAIFMIEPTLVYSNIKNGYGVFGAMTFKQYLLNFRQKTVVEMEIPKKSPSRQNKFHF